jgi:hypothetical protein
VGETPYRTNARRIEPPGLLLETRKERTDAWLELLRFVGEVVLEIVVMGW